MERVGIRKLRQNLSVYVRRLAERRRRPLRGLAAGAGALGDWEELPAIVDEIYAGRRRAGDRSSPDLD